MTAAHPSQTNAALISTWNANGIPFRSDETPTETRGAAMNTYYGALQKVQWLSSTTLEEFELKIRNYAKSRRLFHSGRSSRTLVNLL